jgi:DNA processing protein
MKVNSLKLNSVDFPASLARISRPPAQLFYIGSPISDWITRPKVAIVGSRKTSVYGREVTTKIAGDLARAGIVVISGLAYGTDALAHQTAVDVGGTAVVVLPTSLDNLYPSAHTNLARKIVEQGGTIISEYPPGATTHIANFINRNRIISGLSDLVIITEASSRSGTLSTARFALEQGKTVAAVPGNITSPNSEGTNNLIKSGALPITSVDDVFFALNLTPKKQAEARIFNGSGTEALILKLLKEGISDQEDLALRCNLDGSGIASALITLELSGHIKAAGGGHWVAS